MSTQLHSFVDIFESEFSSDNNKLHLKKIIIPMIQRDYAQGRITNDVNRIRSRFLDSLYSAVVKTPITLDFIYGDIDEEGVMTPLDGQQRLTTLFLLHWYAAKKEDIKESEYMFLENFSYETRYSTRYFCKELIGFKPSFQELISKEIINQAWFPLDWKKDPTIDSMLVMLDEIDRKFRNTSNLWNSLKNNAITFYFLPIKDMGLTDEIYIKMNSRGKPLTLFEHFKAELERNLREIDEKTGRNLTNNIITNIDRKWTDLLWRYHNGNIGDENDNVIDDEFLRYFKFVCDIICYRNGESPQGYSSDVFDLLQQYFSPETHNVISNIETLARFFDCWCDIKGYDNPTFFLQSFMSNKHEIGKIVVDSGDVNIFEDCIHTYSDKTGKIRQFPLNRIVLLYAITQYLQNQDVVSYEKFIRRIRIINNLIQNSKDEISDRLDRNRIPAILKAVDSIIVTGVFDENIDSNFNVNQIEEEKQKEDFLNNNPDKANELFALEDHDMLKGQISIIGLGNLQYGERFASLFTCSWDKIDCALMTIGNYGQQERNKWRFQYASKGNKVAWEDLFHKSANAGFDNTSNILLSLLKSSECFFDSVLDDIIEKYINKCETDSIFPWNYYYIKYEVFRPGNYGKMSNPDWDTKPYLYSVMQTKTQVSQNTYMPYLKEVDKPGNEHLSKDSLGQQLVYNDRYIICDNNSFIIKKKEDDSILEILEIAHNDDKIDTENRIDKLKAYVDKIV